MTGVKEPVERFLHGRVCCPRENAIKRRLVDNVLKRGLPCCYVADRSVSVIEIIKYLEELAGREILIPAHVAM